VRETVEAAGFVVEQMEHEYERGAPRPLGYLTEGVALSPG
jgi:hypothetical protein